jgi:plasmid maintenance system killer protein
MIVSFASRRLARFWYEGDTRGIKPEVARTLRVVLVALDEAEQLSDLQGLRLHRWATPRRRSAKRAKPPPWSIDVVGAWRIHFQWEDHNAYDVDFCQPH